MPKLKTPGIKSHDLRKPIEILQEAETLFKECKDLEAQIGGADFTPKKYRTERLIGWYEELRDKSFIYNLLRQEFQMAVSPPEIMVTV